ncbi:MAG: hypothetical protein EHM72_13300 [Calditrichaeota bacterium]|nr:MAG: hypothetical protein EHM72_13300 [Calditrichota bacterium]
MGNHFFFIKNATVREKRTILRRDDINTSAEFNRFKSETNDQQNYVRLKYPMFPRYSVWPAADVIAFFPRSNRDYELNYASNVGADDFKNKNLLFIGSFHTLSAFDQTLRNSNFSYQVYPNQLSYKNILSVLQV